MKIYLHIGIHKTGSTTLQHFLDVNREVFNKKGFFYPDSKTDFAGHHNLFWEFIEKNRFYENGITWADLFDQIDNLESNAMILSSENFCRLTPDRISWIREKFSNFDVKVIIYLRRQDKLIHSNYAHEVKVGKEVPEFETYLKERVDTQEFNFMSILSPWKEVFGEDNIVVRPFEVKQLFKEDLIEDFLNIIGCSSDSEDFEKIKSVNRAPNTKIFEIIKGLSNILDHSKLSDDEVRRFYALPVLRNASLTCKGDKLNLLNSELSELALSKFDDSNNQIAKEYLNKEKLFLEPIQDKEVSDTSIDEVEPAEWLALLKGVLEESHRKLK